MTDLIKIAVDAMGGDNSPKKTINGIIHNHNQNKNVFYKIFGDEKVIRNIIGDKIKIGGGVRKATKTFPRTLNLEFIQIIKLKKKSKLVNPFCKKCKKNMKSKGKNQGFQCLRCKHTSDHKTKKYVPRLIKKQIYIPSISAHRHLTKPAQRVKQNTKSEKFNPSSPWISNF